MLSPQPYIEITRMSHDALAALVRRPCGDRTMAVCDPRVLLEIRVTNVYNLSFLIEMALQTCKTKIQRKTDTPADSNNDTS